MYGMELMRLLTSRVDDKAEVVPAEQKQQHEEQQLAGVDVRSGEAAPAGPEPREEPQDHQDPEQKADRHMSPPDHDVIWLQPWCEQCHRSWEARTWCSDQVYDDCECGAKPVKYRRVDTTVVADIDELQRLVDRLRARIFDLERRTGVLSRYPPDEEKKFKNRGLG